MSKYYTPEIEEFHVGFEYEVFEMKSKESYKDKNGYFNIPNFKLYSKEYFNELHSNDKYWEYRKWKEKVCDKNTIFNFSSTIFTEKYNPLNIENIIRVKYLDQKDIESLGFILKGKSIDLWFEREGIYLRDDGHHLNNIKLQYGEHDQRLKITFNYTSGEEQIHFEGNIKNKSELKKLIKQLEIE